MIGFIEKWIGDAAVDAWEATAAFFAAVLTGAGISGMYTSKLLRVYACISVKNIVATISFVLLIFLPALAHINFVQFYYCKKYGIDCDEHGNTMSPELEWKPKKVKKVKESKKTGKNGKKKMSLILKVIIGITCIPIAVFILLLFIGFFLSL